MTTAVFTEKNKAAAQIAQQFHSLHNQLHLIERNMFTTVDHENAGPIKVVNFPVKFSETPAYVKSAAPVIGQHNQEVLKIILGYDDEKITALKKANAISE